MYFTSQHPFEEAAVYSSFWGVTAKAQRRVDLHKVTEQISGKEGCEPPPSLADSSLSWAKTFHRHIKAVGIKLCSLQLVIIMNKPMEGNWF